MPTGFTNSSQSDAYTQAYSKLHFYQEQLSQGRIPLWDPYVGCGTSDYPIRSHPLYPTTLISSLLFNTQTAILIDEALAFILFYIFLILFLKSHGLSSFASQMASLSILFSGPLILSLFYPYFIQSITWIPLLFYCQEKIFREQKFNKKWVALGAISLGLQIMAGMLQITLYTLGLLALYAMTKLNQIKPVLKTHITIFFLGLSISAVRLIPLFYSSSQLRPGYETWGFFATCLFKLGDLYQSFAPFDYAKNSPQLYPGVISLIIMAFFIFAGKKKKNDWFWIITALILPLLALKSPLTFLAFKFLPKYKDFNPLRILFISILPLSVILARGLDELTHTPPSKKFLLMELIPVSLWVITFPFIVIIIKGALTKVQIQLVITTFTYVSLVWLLSFLYFKNLVTIRFLVVTLSILMCFDLFSHAMTLTPILNSGLIFRETPIIHILKNDSGLHRIARLGDRWGWDINGRLYNMEALRADNIYDLHAYSSMINGDYRHLIDAFRKSFDFNLNPFDRQAAIQPFLKEEELASPIIDLLGVKYILSLKPLLNNNKFRLKAQEGPLRLYQNLNCSKRAFMVYQAKYLSDRHKVIDTLAKVENLSDLIFIEPDTETTPDEFFGHKGEYEIDIQKYSPEEIIINIKTTEDGYLFLSDIYDKLWQTRIDERPAKLFRANAAFRAVWVKAGSHLVHFNYKPTPFWLGAIISLAGISMASFMLIKK